MTGNGKSTIFKCGHTYIFFHGWWMFHCHGQMLVFWGRKSPGWNPKGLELLNPKGLEWMANRLEILRNRWMEKYKMDHFQGKKTMGSSVWIYLGDLVFAIPTNHHNRKNPTHMFQCQRCTLTATPQDLGRMEQCDASSPVITS